MSVGRIAFWLALLPWLLLVCAILRVPGFG